MGDLGCRVRRGEAVGLVGLEREKTSGRGVAAARFRIKLEGLMYSELLPLERLVKATGSTFSKLSMSRRSALRLPAEGGEAANSSSC